VLYDPGTCNAIKLLRLMMMHACCQAFEILEIGKIHQKHIQLARVPGESTETQKFYRHDEHATKIQATGMMWIQEKGMGEEACFSTHELSISSFQLGNQPVKVLNHCDKHLRQARQQSTHAQLHSYWLHDESK
jgi:hypothetical protein